MPPCSSIPMVWAREGDLGKGGRLADKLVEAGDWLFRDLSRFNGETGGWLELLGLFPGPGDLLLELRKRALLGGREVSQSVWTMCLGPCELGRDIASQRR